MSVSLHPTVLWRTYKRTQNNAKGLRATSICGCVTLNLHLLLNTHHPPLMPPTYQDVVWLQQMVPRQRAEFGPGALVHTHTRITTHTCRHRCCIYSRNTHRSEKGAKWGLSPRNLASLIRRATAKALPTPSSEPSP